MVKEGGVMQFCETCQKEFKNIVAHNRLKHPPKGSARKSEEEIAELLYTDIVKPLCEEKGIKIGEWGTIDQSDYLAVARKIG